MPATRKSSGWFDSNPSLAKLKTQVHFCPVTTNTPIYPERYAGNVKGLPTVRMQKPDGTVVYEGAGKDIPLTAAGLNAAFAGAVNEAARTATDPAVAARRGSIGSTIANPNPRPNRSLNRSMTPTPSRNRSMTAGTPDVEPDAVVWRRLAIGTDLRCCASGRPLPGLWQEAEREVDA